MPSRCDAGAPPPKEACLNGRPATGGGTAGERESNGGMRGALRRRVWASFSTGFIYRHLRPNALAAAESKTPGGLAACTATSLTSPAFPSTVKSSSTQPSVWFASAFVG